MVARTLSAVGDGADPELSRRGRLARSRAGRPRAVATKVLVPVAAAAMVVLGAGAPSAGAQTSVDADDLVARLQAGEAIEQDGLHIVGPLDLRSLGEVTVSLRCEACVITGGVVATDVVFARSVELDGVRIEGDVDLRGAVFQGPVLVRGQGPESGFTGAFDASFASFEDTAGFDGLRFGGDATFTGARFAEEASFSGSTFTGAADFEQVGFGGLTSFNGLRDRAGTVPAAPFLGPVSFRSATFERPADLALRTYAGGLDLSNAVFAEPLSVSLSEVQGLFVAQGTAFASLDARALLVVGDANLTQARAVTASFESARIDGDFILVEMTVSGSTSLQDLVLGGTLNVTRFLSGQLDMDLDLVEQVNGRPAQEDMLESIEATERANGDNATANRAEYELLRIQGESKSGLAFLIDLVFFQWAGGYLVRPSHPLTTLVLLILLGTVARIINDRRRERASRSGMGSELNRAGQVTVRLGAILGDWLNCFSRALAASLRPKPNIAIPEEQREDPGTYLVAGMRLFEYVASKVLILVFLLSMANYNQTLRQLIEGVIP